MSGDNASIGFRVFLLPVTLLYQGATQGPLQPSKAIPHCSHDSPVPHETVFVIAFSIAAKCIYFSIDFIYSLICSSPCECSISMRSAIPDNHVIYTSTRLCKMLVHRQPPRTSSCMMMIRTIYHNPPSRRTHPPSIKHGSLQYKAGRGQFELI